MTDPTMEALIKEGTEVRLCEIPVPRVERPDDVLVRVNVAGICRTDVYVAQGQIASANPIVLGHEFSGTVAQCGDAVKRLAPGDHVTAHPVLAIREHSNASRFVASAFLGVDAHGVFADYVCLPMRNLYKLPLLLDARIAAYVEPVSATLAVLKAGIDPAQRGVISGTGRFSNLARDILCLHGVNNVEVCSRSDLSALKSGSLDFAIETMADEKTFRALINALKPHGMLILKSRAPQAVLFPIREAVAKELTFKAVNYGRFEDAIKLLASGRLMVDHLLGDEFPLEQHVQAFALAIASESKKLFFRTSARPETPCVA